MDHGTILSSGDLGGCVAASAGGSVTSVPPSQSGVPEVLVLTSGRTLESYVPRKV